MDRRFDLYAALLGLWLLSGIFLDGWAHNHIHVENFFTPWHAVLYSGYLANLAFLGVHSWRGRRDGRNWVAAIPTGYLFSALGALLFGVSGVGDLIWHEVFGIEVSVEAGFSPPHLGIMIATGLIVTGPLSAAWRRAERPHAWQEWLPILLSIELALSLMTFVFQYADPLVVVSASIRPVRFHDQALGAVSIVLRTLFMMGWLLTALRRWTLPAGSVAALFAINAIVMTLMRDKFFLVLALVPAAVLIELLRLRLDPSPTRALPYYLFAFSTPVVYYLCYFAAVWLKLGVSWSTPLWTGAILMSGVLSSLLSLAILPPPSPNRQEYS